ncbi:hypothetical protein [Actinomadura napierensis]|uniref:DUF2637 domain-containing protein n=1 Tax=Actinomadura napierensis TaxID=267854 RepID=A0ABN2YEK2_9ACTN
MVANTAPFTSAPARRRRPRRTTSPAAPLRLTLGGLTLGGLTRRRRWERRIALGLAGGAAVMVPWMVVLARTLPSTAHVSNWPMAWMGLDAMIAAGMLGTGVLLARRDPRHGLTAAATGVLLAMDAWFDVLTSAPGPERALALAMAAGLELPLACTLTALAARSLNTTASSVQPPTNTPEEEGRRPEAAGALHTGTRSTQPLIDAPGEEESRPETARALRTGGPCVQPTADVRGEEGRRPENVRPGGPVTWAGAGVRGVEDGRMKDRWQSIDASTPDG